MSVLCGKCHEHHDSVDDVRRCFSALPTASTTTNEQEAVSVEARGENFFLTGQNQGLYDNHVAEMERQQREVHKDRMSELMGDHPGHGRPTGTAPQGQVASAAQQRFIADLRKQKGLPELSFTGTKRQASEEIDRLKALPSKAQTGPIRMERTEHTEPKESPYEDIPPGRYALFEEDEFGDEVWRFYHVTHGRKGTRWEGYTFLEIQFGSETEQIRNRERRERVLADIRVDPKAASAAYGRELGHCGLCGRELTNPASIEMGIGPICADKAGW